MGFGPDKKRTSKLKSTEDLPTIAIPFTDTYSGATREQKTIYEHVAGQYKALGADAYFKKYGIDPYIGRKIHKDLTQTFTNPKTKRLTVSQGYLFHKIHKAYKILEPALSEYTTYLTQQQKKTSWH